MSFGDWLSDTFGGKKFSSDQYNKQNALNQNDPDIADAEAKGKAAQQGSGGEAIGSWYGDYGLSHNRDSANVSQTPLERLAERRRNYYYGGTPNAANAGAEGAQNTGNLYASYLTGQADKLNARGDTVFDRAYGPEGPSAAQALLNKGTNQAIGTQLTLARSGRGMGESAAALDTAGRNAATLQTDAANNAAILRAQEAEAYAQRKDAFQRNNDAAALGFGQAAQGGYQQAGQSSLAGQQLGYNIQNSALGASQDYEQNLLNYYNIKKGGNLQQDQMNRADRNAYLAAGASLFAASDERLKADKSRGDFKDSSGAFDPLTTSPENPDALKQRLTAFESDPRALVKPARATFVSPSYQPASSSFAQELNQTPNAGRPDSRTIVDPWSASSAQSGDSTADPWAKYLDERNRREEQRKYDEESEKAGQKGLSAGVGVIGLGALLASLSDIRSKRDVRSMGYATSDANSKDEISRLQVENRSMRTQLDSLYPEKHAVTMPVDYHPREIDTSALPRVPRDQAAEAEEQARRARVNSITAVAPPAVPAEQSPVLPPRYQVQIGDAQIDGGSTASAQDAVRSAPGYSYRYKQPSAPGAAPGTHYGPMAQDLERTPVGRSTVVTAPNGTKMVDTPRLTLVNTAALHGQQQEIDDLQRKLDALRAGGAR